MTHAQDSDIVRGAGRWSCLPQTVHISRVLYCLMAGVVLGAGDCVTDGGGGGTRWGLRYTGHVLFFLQLRNNAFDVFLWDAMAIECTAKNGRR